MASIDFIDIETVNLHKQNQPFTTDYLFRLNKNTEYTKYRVQVRVQPVYLHHKRHKQNLIFMIKMIKKTQNIGAVRKGKFEKIINWSEN